MTGVSSQRALESLQYCQHKSLLCDGKRVITKSVAFITNLSSQKSIELISDFVIAKDIEACRDDKVVVTAKLKSSQNCIHSVSCDDKLAITRRIEFITKLPSQTKVESFRDDRYVITESSEVTTTLSAQKLAL